MQLRAKSKHHSQTMALRRHASSIANAVFLCTVICGFHSLSIGFDFANRHGRTIDGALTAGIERHGKKPKNLPSVVEIDVDANLDVNEDFPFTACAPHRFGRLCDSECDCPDGMTCDDGPLGSGACISPSNVDLYSHRSRHDVWNRKEVGGVLENEKHVIALPGVRFQHIAMKALFVNQQRQQRPTQIYNASLVLSRPTPFRGTPRMLLFDRDLGKHLGFIDVSDMHSQIDENIRNRDVLSGNAIAKNAAYYAHAYGGHQFGHWAGQLGDGRAISLGEVAVDMKQDRSRSWGMRQEVSIKGAGKTAFSRKGDGRAVMRNLVREYLCSAFLNGLGVPATQALALVASSSTKHDGILRDEWYSGQLRKVRPGVLTRIAPSFLRIGSIQLAAERQSQTGLIALARHILQVIDELEKVSWKT